MKKLLAKLLSGKYTTRKTQQAILDLLPKEKTLHHSNIRNPLLEGIIKAYNKAIQDVRKALS